MRSSRIASRATSRGWPGSHTRGITSTASWARSRRRRGSCWRAPCARCSPTVSPSWGFGPPIGCSVGRLGVFAAFRPKLPERFRNARYVFLGNIDPELQLGVLDQVRDPILVACDTMNYWIHSKKDLLLELLRHIDILMVNDSEARELSGDWNIYRAAQWVLSRGPTMTVIKQGEHG